MRGLGTTVGLAVAVVIGVGIAYVDGRPGWDDTGITAFALLTVAGVLGLVLPHRPWRWALAVGLWLPLWEGVASGNYALLLTLLIPLAGAYAGALARRVLRPAPVA